MNLKGDLNEDIRNFKKLFLPVFVVFNGSNCIRPADDCNVYASKCDNISTFGNCLCRDRNGGNYISDPILSTSIEGKS